MPCNWRTFRSRGFSLNELLIVIAIIAILSGMTLLATGRSSDSARAAVIMQELDAVKNAMLSYSMEHRTRTSDGLSGWGGAASSVILASLDNYLDEKAVSGADASTRLNKLEVQYGENNAAIEVGFVNFSASGSLQRSITAKLQNASSQYTGSGSSDSYTLWLKVK
jgi:prepilin-type N-terminal cleavage/methylation domain-containing protein